MKTARDLCIRFEGVYLKPYRCPANIPTIGIGSTAYEDGKKVTMTDPPITLERAYSLLDTGLDKTYRPAARKLCPGSNQGLQEALTDFCYNLGCTRLAGSTLRRKVNAGDLEGAKLELAKWVRGGGRILPGLVSRRAAEARLF